jgi:hypothetical protein
MHSGYFRITCRGEYLDKRETEREREEIIGWRYSQGTAAGCGEHANETSVSIKSKEFLDQLSDYLLTNKDFHPCNQLIYIKCWKMLTASKSGSYY